MKAEVLIFAPMKMSHRDGGKLAPWRISVPAVLAVLAATRKVDTIKKETWETGGKRVVRERGVELKV